MRIELRVLKIMLPVELVPVAQLTGSHSSQHGAPVGSPELARQIQDKLQLAGKGFSAVTGSALSASAGIRIGNVVILNRNEHAGEQLYSISALPIASGGQPLSTC
jgi:hypothetical protein